MPLNGVPELVVGSLTVPNRAGIEMQATYRDEEGGGLLRMADGSVRKVTIWSGKITIDLSGDGLIPAALQPGVTNYATTHTIKAPTARSVWSASNVITIPAARRTDLAQHAIGIALLGAFDATETPVSMGGHVATLTAVAGAVAYMACYWPQFTGWLSQHSVTHNRRQARDRWSVTITEA